MLAALLLLSQAAPAKNITVIYNFPEGTSPDIEEAVSLPNDANAFHAFMQVAELHDLEIDMTYYPGFGAWFINSINGVENSAAEYWHFFENRELAAVGISQFIPGEGDVIELGFASEPSSTMQMDAQDAAGWLASNQDSNGQIGNHAVWGNGLALIALNLFPGNETVKGNAAEYLLANQGQDAGFAYPGYESDALHTAVSVMGLASNGLALGDFGRGETTSIDFLASKQEQDAGFSGWGQSDVDTTSWAAMAFAAAGKPLPTKQGQNPLDYLFSAQNQDGGFGYRSGQESSQEYTSEVLIALALSGWERDSSVENALDWIEGQQEQGCLSSSYTTALAAIAQAGFEESPNSALQCLRRMQLPDNGFGRDGKNSNSVDTAMAAIALSGHGFPASEVDENPPGVIPVGSVVRFTVEISNPSAVTAKDAGILLEGIEEDWIQKETSTLSIAEIRPGETKRADIYVTMGEPGQKTVYAVVSSETLLSEATSNALEFQVAAAYLEVVLSM
ncbi:MAG: DUF4430 domain-containing protein [Candidatus Diapherotrites archaeon]|uniref:DUF4430 domain-containing protein n=1 Tax=Candidatus Iainarchaeum sp. TaxID=3101447 RepID=A0A939C498_9ARCH|nr:DUF4430 domain-containing protein [Candidatus Diapherotrites archaeon]